MKIPGPILLLALLLPGPVRAQGGIPKRNAKPRDPFKAPFRFFVPRWSIELKGEIRAVLEEAKVLERIWSSAKDRAFDEEGRPTCKTGGFEKRVAAFRARLGTMAGHLGLVLRDHVRTDWRRAAHFASFFVPRVQDSLDLFSYLPYEPDFGARRTAIPRILPFLRAQAGRRGENGKLRYSFDYQPYVDLCRVRWTPDRRLAFRVLGTLAKADRDSVAEAARFLKPWIEKALVSGDKSPRREVVLFLNALDPDARIPSSPEEAVAAYRGLIRRLFPDILLKDGLCEIRPGRDRDRLVEVGREWIRSGKVGFRDQVSVEGSPLGVAYGLRLRKIPEPVDRLGLKEGDLLTALDGQPILSPEDLLTALEARLRAGARSLVLEWIDAKGKRRARRFLLLRD